MPMQFLLLRNLVVNNTTDTVQGQKQGPKLEDCQENTLSEDHLYCPGPPLHSHILKITHFKEDYFF